jgi:hypothetical protein
MSVGDTGLAEEAGVDLVAPRDRGAEVLAAGREWQKLEDVRGVGESAVATITRATRTGGASTTDRDETATGGPLSP